MKPFFGMLIIMLTLATGCAEKDYSAYVKELDNYVNTINLRVDQDRSVVKIPDDFIDNKTTTIEYFIMDGELAKILVVDRTESFTKSIHFHLNGQKLAHVLYRYIRKDINPYAEETNSYLQNGKIVYATERTLNLDQGKSAGILRSMPFIKSQRSYKKLFQDFNDYWPSALKTVEKHRNQQ